MSIWQVAEIVFGTCLVRRCAFALSGDRRTRASRCPHDVAALIAEIRSFMNAISAALPVRSIAAR